jgi:hypothetical protein
MNETKRTESNPKATEGHGGSKKLEELWRRSEDLKMNERIWSIPITRSRKVAWAVEKSKKLDKAIKKWKKEAEGRREGRWNDGEWESVSSKWYKHTFNRMQNRRRILWF